MSGSMYQVYAAGCLHSRGLTPRIGGATLSAMKQSVGIVNYAWFTFRPAPDGVGWSFVS